MPTPRASRQRAHLSSARAAILDVLTDQPEPCTVKAIAARTRQHQNTIREHLDGLVGDQLVIRTRASGGVPGRPAWLYSATPDPGSDRGAGEYAGLASTLAALIARTSQHPHADAVEAGRSWGRQLVRQSAQPASAPAPAFEGGGNDPRPADGSGTTPPSPVAARRQVVALLDRLGFAPSPDARIAVVKLRRCPLLAAAHQQPEVVCGVHLGVVRGALEELGADPARVERTALQPFSEPGACRLDLLARPATNR